LTTDAAFTLEDEIGHAPVQMDRPGAPRWPRQPTAQSSLHRDDHQATARRCRRRPDRGARRV